jgi:hypothetical protein
MRPPFSVHEFFAVFARYNEAVWPMQLVLLLLALLTVTLVYSRGRLRSRAINLITGFFWIWMAVAYHLAHFAIINPAARMFAALFLVQAALLIGLGVIGSGLEYERPRGLRGIAGGVLVAYGLFAYPLIGVFSEHGYLSSPTFGVPCPTTIFALGMFCFLRQPFHRAVLAVPVVWAMVGSSAAFFLRVPQDFGLLVAGAVGVALAATMRSAPNGTAHRQRVKLDPRASLETEGEQG